MGRGGGHGSSGFSGGGRGSSGFSGGGRSYGSHSGSSGRSSGRSSRSSGSSSRSSGYRAPAVFIRSGGGGGGSSSGSGKNPNGGKKGGCLKYVLIGLLVLVVIGLISTVMNTVKTRSNHREPIDAAKTFVDGGYFRDNGFYESINPSASLLKDGLDHFRKKTGVKPYIYFTPDIDGDTAPTESAKDAFAEKAYNELFKKGDKIDGTHLLLLWVESENVDASTYYWCGQVAESVLDDGAFDILTSEIAKYYDDDSYDSYGAFLGAAFASAADEMMKTPSEGLKSVALLLVIAIALVLVLWWLVRKEKKIEEDKATAEILKAPLKEYPDEAEKLAKKYGGSGKPEEPGPAPEKPEEAEPEPVFLEEVAAEPKEEEKKED